MSGHSKWSTIKRKKAANDAKRGNIFTRLAREIALAAREGGGDSETNFGLRLAVERARAANMPKENIERAIKRGTGEDKDAAAFERLLYEGYAAPGRDREEIVEPAVEGGAEDVVFGDDSIEIIAPVEAFKSIGDMLRARGIKADEAGLRMIPTTSVELPSAQALQVMRTIEAIEDMDDTQQVF